MDFKTRTTLTQSWRQKIHSQNPKALKRKTAIVSIPTGYTITAKLIRGAAIQTGTCYYCNAADIAVSRDTVKIISAIRDDHLKTGQAECNQLIIKLEEELELPVRCYCNQPTCISSSEAIMETMLDSVHDNEIAA